MRQSPVKSLKIGKVACRNNLVLAPMAGITDSPLRRLCIRGGAGLVVGEMVSAQAIKYGNKKTEKMLFLSEKEHPVAVQIFGADAEAISIAARAAEAQGADIVDINAGCPVKKINKSGAGAVLMSDEKKFGGLIAAAVKAVGIPVTVKIRIGLEKGKIISPKFALIAENEGACAVTVHGRFARNMHNGPVDLDALAATCAAVKIPVIGNGGVDGPQKAQEILKTGCRGVMIGRAAIGDPFIFGRIAKALRGGKYTEPSSCEKVRLFLKLLKMNADYYGEEAGLTRCRKVVGFWLCGFANSSAVRTKFMSCKKFADTKQLLTQVLSSI